MRTITPSILGDPQFRKDYGLRYAYLAGGMYKAISSAELVIAMGKAGFMGFLGTGGVALAETEASIRTIQRELTAGQSYGVNVLCNHERPDLEAVQVEMLLKLGVRFIEAAAYMSITPSLVRYRLTGAKLNDVGEPEVRNRIVAKVSRPEVAAIFMQPPPEAVVSALVKAGQLSAAEAAVAPRVPMAAEICVEADSGGHTDQGVAFALMPAMLALRDDAAEKHGYAARIRIGAAGGIGTAHAAAAAFIMGADFIVTGSINQCTVEAGTSDAVKDILQELNVQDTAYAPAGDMFEIGAKIQVVKRGLFFPVRANKLYELYQRYNALDEIDAKTKQQIQEKYLKRSFEEVWKETRAHYLSANPTKVAEIDGNPKQKMALIFKWYFVHSTRLALSGDAQQRVDYQIQCGPALGAFNQTVRSTALQSWRQRRVAEIGLHIMESAAELLDRWYAGLSVKRHIGLPFLANRNSELGVSGHSVGHHEVSAASGRLEYEASC